MTYRYVWVMSCPRHPDFFCRHYKKSFVINAVKMHVAQEKCGAISTDEIRREEAPSDTDMW
jgi:hypothetical protein